ncbi:hypothetical protein TNCV_1115991, partial [Trichonephila clavipes]
EYRDRQPTTEHPQVKEPQFFEAVDGDPADRSTKKSGCIVRFRFLADKQSGFRCSTAAWLGTGSRRDETKLRLGHTRAQRHAVGLKFTLPFQIAM